MVKNTTGGSGHKSQARKLVVSGKPNQIRLSLNDSEKYARVSKMFGNGMCLVLTDDGIELNCHIRGKFRGRNKKNNLVSPSSFLLVGLREWENPIKNCDLLYLYEHDDLPLLPPNLIHPLSLLSPSDNILFSDLV